MLKKAPNRLSYHQQEEIVDLPNLIEVQLKSFKRFLQQNSLPSERLNEGLEEVFREVFPIKSYDDKVILEYLSYSLGAPKYQPDECLRRGISYQVTLRVKFRLIDETGIKEEEVYMGSIPIMTSKGTFVINGAERVIVSQLHRSPGLSFETEMHPRGGRTLSFKIIPYRGSWMEASFDAADSIYIYVDRKKRRRKILATTFIRSLGFSSDEEIIEEFFQIKKVRIKSEADIEKYVGLILAQDMNDEESSISYGRAGEKLTTAMLKKMIDSGITTFNVAIDADENSPIIKMLAKDPTDSYEAALKDFYRKIRPGEPATLSNARSTMMRLFFDPRRYNLGRVGRYKINKKLGLPITQETIENVTLTRDDIIESIKYLINIRQNKSGFAVDDIDHLGNRRVRSVGELIQNQCRIGLARMEKIIKERVNLFDFSSDTLTPSKVVSSKGLSGVLKDFFGRSQLSQFMDQANPVSELTHKRRLSSLGPGGLSRDRATFEVRDVHPSHYGRICPIETPEGPNIGLITSMASYAKVNDFGFIETPYRIVRDGVVTSEVTYMTADEEEKWVIAEASTKVDSMNMFVDTSCWARARGETIEVGTDKVTHMDVSPKQLVSIVTGLIPFLEHNDANRALMGSNMQRQAVPLLQTEAPFVGTGLEKRAAIDSGAVIVAKHRGTVEYVDGNKIVIAPESNPVEKEIHYLKKFQRSNAGTCINQHILCAVGDTVEAGDVIADGPSTDAGEIALGRNVLVAYMSWSGYNYEDAIIISSSLIEADTFSSIHIAEFEANARETKLGEEKITADIPNLPEEALLNLSEDGIVRVGTEVRTGDILVGKITPKTETELSPEERLLRAIFGEKASDVKDASLVVPPGVKGVVMDVRVFSRRDRLAKGDDDFLENSSKLREVYNNYKDGLTELEISLKERLSTLALQQKAPATVINKKTADVLIKDGQIIDEAMLEAILDVPLDTLLFPPHALFEEMKAILQKHAQQLEQVETDKKTQLELLKKGDADLDPGIVRQVKVYIATEHNLQEGDKMAGRHGNKGVVAKIVPKEDMPYLPDGRAVQMILNPLGVVSRMNIGQLFETHLGIALQKLGLHAKAPAFESFPIEKVRELMSEAGVDPSGKTWLYDGRTGERFDSPVTVGYYHMLKLNHLVMQKSHARATGSYSLVTQQPLGGKAQMGGQRFGEMEVWALEAYGASYLLREMLTVKSDDVDGRARIYESIVKGNNTLMAGVPESFNVLLKEIMGLGLNIKPCSLDEEAQSDEGSSHTKPTKQG